MGEAARLPQVQPRMEPLCAQMGVRLPGMKDEAPASVATLEMGAALTKRMCAYAARRSGGMASSSSSRRRQSPSACGE